MASIVAIDSHHQVAMDDFAVAFGAHIRALRLSQRLSQEEVAHRAGIHVTYLSGIERGKRNPALKNLRRIAQALDVPIMELFAFDASS